MHTVHTVHTTTIAFITMLSSSQYLQYYLFCAVACDTLQAFHSLRLQLHCLAAKQTPTGESIVITSLQGLTTGDKKIVDLFLD